MGVGACATHTRAYGQADAPPVRQALCQDEQERCRDAEAIYEAVSRPAMRGVSIKTVEQADLQAVHRTQALFMKRTAVINQIRGLLAEQG
jgi:transposase